MFSFCEFLVARPLTSPHLMWLYSCKGVFFLAFSETTEHACIWQEFKLFFPQQGSIKLQVCLVYSTCVLVYPYIIIKNNEMMHLVPESCDIFGLNIAVVRFRSQFWGYKTFWMHLIQQKNILEMTNYLMLTLYGHNGISKVAANIMFKIML